MDIALAGAVTNTLRPPPLDILSTSSSTQGSGGWTVVPSSSSSASSTDESVDDKFNAVSNEIRSYIKSGGKVAPDPGQEGFDPLKSEVHQAIRDYLALTNAQPDPVRAGTVRVPDR